MEVTKQDIVDLHNKIESINDKTNNKIDELVKSTNILAINVQKITTTLDLTPKHDRPCSDLVNLKKSHEEHIENHKETVRLWYSPIIKSVVHIVELAIVALATWFFIKKE